MKRHRVLLPPPLPPTHQEALLDPDGSHHLLVVCRHPRGGALLVTDGAGCEAEAMLVGVHPDGRALLRITSEIRAIRGRPDRHLVLGVPKGPALEAALRMAVELGATHLWPVVTQRTVARGDHPERWTKILRAAAAQSGRATLPALAPLGSLGSALDALDGVPDLVRRVAVPGAEPAPAVPERPAALAVGPEGGFEPAEVQRLASRGWVPVGLGPHVLRVDTAVAVGMASLGWDAATEP